MFPPALLDRAAALLATAGSCGIRIATAESCTGGLVAALLTEIAGSSSVFERGFVTYSNEAKTALLGVPAVLIGAHGAVSAACARAMAEGALLRSRASLAVSVTGIAGPGGGTAEKPVGLVHFAMARGGVETVLAEQRFASGERGSIRLAAVVEALRLLEHGVNVAGGSVDGG